MSNTIPDPVVPTMLSSGPLEEVRHLKVSLSNPPTSTSEGLDFERCSALHNAIIRYQWKARGYNLASMPTTTWWQTPQFASQLNEIETVLPESLIQFLKRALNLEHWPDWHSTFFHFVQSLASPKEMWREVVNHIEYHDDDERIALYTTNCFMKFSDQTQDGIIYDCWNHSCMYNSYDHGSFGQAEEEAPLPWQYLETVLTAWIDMIERGKAIVLSASELSHIGEDPGYNNLRKNDHSAWVWANFTRADVDDTISAWEDLVCAINDRLPAPFPRPFPSGLFRPDDLIAAGIRQGTFAWEFYTKACKPPFRFLGPGSLQVPSRDQLLNSPFEAGWKVNTKHPTMNDKPILPLPVLLGEERTKSWVDEYNYTAEPPLWGLYLDKFYDRYSHDSYEDGARLVLTALSENTPARMLDGKKAKSIDLYQIGQSPFALDHPTPLWAILRNFVSHVVGEQWRVGVDGVDEPISVFENLCANPEPDSEEAGENRHDDLLCTYIAGWLHCADSGE